MANQAGLLGADGGVVVILVLFLGKEQLIGFQLGAVLLKFTELLVIHRLFGFLLRVLCLGQDETSPVFEGRLRAPELLPAPGDVLYRPSAQNFFFRIVLAFEVAEMTRS